MKETYYKLRWNFKRKIKSIITSIAPLKSYELIPIIGLICLMYRLVKNTLIEDDLFIRGIYVALCNIPFIALLILLFIYMI